MSDSGTSASLFFKKVEAHSLVPHPASQVEQQERRGPNETQAFEDIEVPW